jgi:hypothetical protein
MVHPGTLFHRRQRGIPMHSYGNRSEIRALLRGAPCIFLRVSPLPSTIVEAWYSRKDATCARHPGGPHTPHRVNTMMKLFH